MGRRDVLLPRAAMHAGHRRRASWGLGLAMLTVGRRRLDCGRSEVEVFRRWSSSKHAAYRGWGARVEAEVIDVPPCRDRRWRRLELNLDKISECMSDTSQTYL
jgi:hypothetical protein